ncbi:low-density lipoprotein receptor-related protein 3-like [Gigantopelta aegis]|uniref:low-density lipoprotein receptor-related protein 3-like n=1 Tax=Gigantopelta aegis TaxID=1735272 RepID=UPI001B8883ED|nr:low-density lipoprotein receptor-related protein 3-like [Gigantopelta aegis]
MASSTCGYRQFQSRQLILFCVIINCVSSLTIDYLPTVCNGKASTTTSLWLESSTALTYTNDVSCTYEITVTAGKQVLALFQRFELENKLGGACVDYVELYEGSGVSGTKLTSERLCGKSLPVNHTSSGNAMMLYFKTDNSGTFRGFSLLFVEINPAPCGTSQFRCNNSLCISASLRCDNYNHCGDDSDEADCAETETEQLTKDNTALILGATFGSLAFVLLVTGVAYYVYNRNKWRRFLADHWEDEGAVDTGLSYPVTDRYFKGRRGHPKYDKLQDGVAENIQNSQTEQTVPPVLVSSSPS